MEIKLKDVLNQYGERKVNKEELEKLLLPEVKKTMHNIEKGDPYFWVAVGVPITTVCSSIWDGDAIDRYKVLTNIASPTIEGANKLLREKEVEMILRKYATPVEEFDWKDGEQQKHSFFVAQKRDKFVIERGINFTCTRVMFYFKTRELMEEAISAVGEERLISYLTGTL